MTDKKKATSKSSPKSSHAYINTLFNSGELAAVKATAHHSCGWKASLQRVQRGKYRRFLMKLGLTREEAELEVSLLLGEMQP